MSSVKSETNWIAWLVLAMALVSTLIYARYQLIYSLYSLYQLLRPFLPFSL